MLTNDKTIRNNVILSIVQIVIAVFLLFFCLAGLAGILGEEDYDVFIVWFVIFWTTSTVWLLYCGIKRFRMVKCIKRYKKTIGNIPCATFRELASLLGESEKKIQQNIEWMIDKYFFADACINYEEKVVYFKAAYQRMVIEGKIIQKAKHRVENHLKNINLISDYCECCGAINMIEPGGGGLCEYCRAPIGKDKELADREE